MNKSEDLCKAIIAKIYEGKEVITDNKTHTSFKRAIPTGI